MKSQVSEGNDEILDTHTLLEKEKAKQEYDEMTASKTNLHYRKFYEDELENDTSIFADPNEPFRNIDVKRGQSRGLSKSWFSLFSADKEDESG
jgi:hypothetical protein